MKLIKRIYKTALYLAIEKGNIEIIKLLLNCENIDVNIPYVFFYYYFTYRIYIEIFE